MAKTSEHKAAQLACQAVLVKAPRNEIYYTAEKPQESQQ